ncbi:MAG: lipoyl(octanoyl) transferase LipB [Mariprofundales bacterium]
MKLLWLGEQPYLPLMEKMKQHAASLRHQKREEVIWCCQHPPVYTTGRRAIDNRTHPTLPAPLIISDRGGETTFHGPGQIMLYPIVNIRKYSLNVRKYVTLLEESCIQLLANHGVASKRRDHAPGVWTERGKIAAIGLRISHGVAWHGMALNVSTDLAWFEAIQPCGLTLAPDRMLNHIDHLPPLEALANAWSREVCMLLRACKHER